MSESILDDVALDLLDGCAPEESPIVEGIGIATAGFQVLPMLVKLILQLPGIAFVLSTATSTCILREEDTRDGLPAAKPHAARRRALRLSVRARHEAEFAQRRRHRRQHYESPQKRGSGTDFLRRGRMEGDALRCLK